MSESHTEHAAAQVTPAGADPTEPSSRCRLRAMTTADVPAVLELERILFPSDAWPESFFHDELAQTEEAGGSAHATRRYWVAEGDVAKAEWAGSGTQGPVELIGYAGMMCVLPLADVQTIAVAPSAQGMGCGTMLLAAIETEARSRQAEDLLLEVREDNPAAQRLYRRTGFEEIHRRPRYYPDGGSALIMRKRLRAPREPGATNFGRSI